MKRFFLQKIVVSTAQSPQMVSCINYTQPEQQQAEIEIKQKELLELKNLKLAIRSNKQIEAELPVQSNMLPPHQTVRYHLDDKSLYILYLLFLTIILHAEYR